VNLDGRPFGAREFQLVMLRRMADYQPQLVDDARRRLGATATDMRAVNAAWQRRMRSPRGSGVGLKDLRQILGVPVADVPRKVGDLSCRVLQWELELWPGLRFEVLVGPGGVVVSELLVRAPGTVAPQPEGIADLTPWHYVISDVERAFAPVRHVEGSAPGRWTTLVTVGEERFAVDFVWGLLQEVRALA
jgi:hypothetical protein